MKAPSWRAPPNCPLRSPKYHPIEAMRPLIESGSLGGCRGSLHMCPESLRCHAPPSKEFNSPGFSQQRSDEKVQNLGPRTASVPGPPSPQSQKQPKRPLFAILLGSRSALESQTPDSGIDHIAWPQGLPRSPESKEHEGVSPRIKVKALSFASGNGCLKNLGGPFTGS